MSHGARPSENWPRLTETLPWKGTNSCRACGQDTDVRLSLWVEHDHLDRPEPRYLWLCTKCADRIIEPHVRLYAQIDRNSPAPGAMEICLGCRFTNGSRCTNPAAKQNDGPGLEVTTPKPIVAFVDGTRNGRRAGWVERVYDQPPKACSGRKEP